MTGTYKRNHEGDYNCTETEVRQMLRDASDDPQDFQLLEDYGLEDPRSRNDKNLSSTL